MLKIKSLSLSLFLSFFLSFFISFFLTPSISFCQACSTSLSISTSLVLSLSHSQSLSLSLSLTLSLAHSRSTPSRCHSGWLDRSGQPLLQATDANAINQYGVLRTLVQSFFIIFLQTWILAPRCKKYGYIV